jgi:TonB family protein
MKSRSRSRWPVVVLACLGLTNAALGQGKLDSNTLPHEYAPRVQAKARALGFILDYDQLPEPIKVAAARYPRGTEAGDRHDAVTVMLAIDAQGRVRDAEILEGIAALNEAALACVKEWRFKPAQKAGLPVGTVMVAPVMFVMAP